MSQDDLHQKETEPPFLPSVHFKRSTPMCLPDAKILTLSPKSGMKLNFQRRKLIGKILISFLINGKTQTMNNIFTMIMKKH